MKEATLEFPLAPIWARPAAFPKAPTGYGWADRKNILHSCDSLASLTAAIRDDPDGHVTLIWTPDSPHMILPEEFPGISEALHTARSRWSFDDMEFTTARLRNFGIILAGLALWTFYRGFTYAAELASKSGITADLADRLKFALRTTLSSTQTGLALLAFLILAFIPWYQARKRRINLGKWNHLSPAAVAPTIRFETWLDRQKAPFTRLLLILITLVGIAQIFTQIRASGWTSLLSVLTHWDGVTAAGLTKIDHRASDWWRFLTTPFLHGNIVHFLMNASALAYLGKRVEVFARWPHLPLVFLFSAVIGSEASVRLVTASSVGASGGLMGLLGFLLVFETLHKSLVPLDARRRLAAGVFLTALIGIVGYRYIDNAAHAGGLIAGMLYAIIIFPSSASPLRPKTTLPDRLAGAATLLILTASALFAIARIIAHPS